MPPARSHTGPAALFAAICALAFGLAAFLYGARLEATLAQVEASRVRFTLGDLRTDFEKSLDRGFAIGQLANAQAALEAEARQDSDVLSLTVLDENGRRVFHAGENVPVPVPAQDGVRRTSDAITASTTLSYNYGVPAGTLLIRYSHRPHDEIMAALALRLALAALAATAISTLAFVAGLRKLERRRRAVGLQVENALGAARIPPATEEELAQLVDKVNQTAATALVELTAARHAVSGSGAGR
ncbi:MAG TPA: hypothetical protein VFT37_07395 [Telluria sp.]|nr:hypothetical protein [Telluria sp.]